MGKLSVIVITFNEENNIRECLSSVDWCDEIIIVDSGSTDKTRDIASEFTRNIIVTENIPYGIKRNMGIERSTCDWILWIDADERVTVDLKEEINKLISSNSGTKKAFLINRKSFFINKFIRHSGWYPDYTLRLFTRDSGIKFDNSLVHEGLSYSGQKGKLRGEIVHYTDLSFEHYVSKLNNYTSLSAEELFEKGRKYSVIDVIFRPVFTFFKMYFLRLGILDGYMGLVLCTLSGFHVFIKYSKVYFKQRNK